MRLFSIICTLFLVSASADADTLVLAGGRLIDGYGGTPLENSVVVIEGNKVVAVGAEGTIAVPPGAKVIDTNGYTVMPGLMDMHVHLMILGHGNYDHWDRTYPSQFRDVIMPISAKQLLMAGVTTARDLGAPLEDIVAVKRRIERGEIPGPRMFVSGPFLQKSNTPLDAAFRWIVNGPEDARKKVRTIVEGGADVIKLIDQDQMTLEEVKAIVDEAHKHGKHVAAHAAPRLLPPRLPPHPHAAEQVPAAPRVGRDDRGGYGLRHSPELPLRLDLARAEDDGGPRHAADGGDPRRDVLARAVAEATRPRDDRARQARRRDRGGRRPPDRHVGPAARGACGEGWEGLSLTR